ncbi:MAG: formate dehydrogenase accessory protein FdhE [Desulfobacteraceae bacterium]|nr:MAG: formate dehydrogenase accessory protein FdhE [Desulfobacteraceae bacterium]
MSNKLLAQIDRVIQKRPLYKEALSTYRELVSVLEGIEPELPSVSKDEAVTETKVKQGFPVFSREDLPLDLKATSSLFPRLLEHLSSQKREDSKALRKALDRVQTDPQWIERAITAFLSRDETTFTTMAQEVNLEPMVLRFVTSMALKPSLNALREAVGERIQKETWNYGYCPLCGSSPDMASLDDQGKRILHCELCGSEWRYPRLKCPFCENSEPKELGYFVSEEEEGFRVDFCKKCKVYIKTLDMRVVESPAPLELENIITLHLDMLAHEQGFKTPSG